MATTHLRLRLVLGLALVMAGVACSNTSSSLMPTGPSGRGGSSSGAVITGRVSGVPLASISTDTITTRASTSLRVTISGTNISTTVDGSGQFTLTGVPPGTVTLTFTGSGISASITLTGVAAGTEIHIEVRLNGNSARIESENRRDGDDDDEDDNDEIEGNVSGLTGTCPAITFMVGTRTIKTSSTTVFEDPCSLILNTVRVEVKGLPAADGTFSATRVEIED